MAGKKSRFLLASLVAAGLMVSVQSSWADSASTAAEGMAALDAKSYTAAIKDFKKTTQAEPKNSAAYFLLGYAYYQRGFAGGNPEAADKTDAQAAIDAYQKVLDLDPTLDSVAKPYEFYFTAALSYEAIGQNARSLANFKKAIAADSDNFLIPLYAARLRFLTQNIGKAKADLALSLKRAHAQGRRDDLISLIKSNALFSPMVENAVLQTLLGQNDVAAPQDDSSAQTDSAAESLHDSIQSQSAALPHEPVLSPEDRIVLSQVAAGKTAYYEGRYDDALKSYQEALKLDATMEVLGTARVALVDEQIGMCHRNLGLTALAASDFEKTVALVPFDADAHYQLSLADAVLGETSQSLKELEWSFKTAPSQEDLRRYLILSQVDPDLGAVRDMPAYAALMSHYSDAAQTR